MGSGNGVLSTYKSHNQILNTDYTFPEIWPRNGGGAKEMPVESKNPNYPHRCVTIVFLSETKGYASVS